MPSDNFSPTQQAPLAQSSNPDLNQTSQSVEAARPAVQFATPPSFQNRQRKRAFQLFAGGLLFVLLVAGGVASLILKDTTQDLRQQAAGYSQSELEAVAYQAQQLAAQKGISATKEQSLAASQKVIEFKHAPLAKAPPGKNSTEKTWESDVNTVIIRKEQDPNYIKPFEFPKNINLQAGAAVNLSTASQNALYPEQTSIIRSAGLNAQLDANATLPVSYDWRAVHGGSFVSNIKDQGNCGSCTVFSSTAVLEGGIAAYFNQLNPNLDLSEQDAISCNPLYIENGQGVCSTGGTPQKYFAYSSSAGVIPESCNAYRACDPTSASCACPASRCGSTAIASVTYKSNQQAVPVAWQNTTNAISDNYAIANNIKRAIIEHGPVTATIPVFKDLYTYVGGIYTKTAPAQYDGLHAIAVVGWGKDQASGLSYWIIKNSWSTGWGESGYFRYLMQGANPGATGNVMDTFYGIQGKNLNFDPGIETMAALYTLAEIPSVLYTKSITVPTSQTPACTDRDADGYCFWGVDRTKPATGCPASCAAQAIPDCNDGVNTVGPNCQTISPPAATPTPTQIATPTPTKTPTPTQGATTPTPTKTPTPTLGAGTPSPTRTPTPTLGAGTPSPTQQTASPTPTTPPSDKQGDLNQDRVVNQSDVDLLIQVYGMGSTVKPKADLNSDGRINAIDYARILDLIGT